MESSINLESYFNEPALSAITIIPQGENDNEPGHEEDPANIVFAMYHALAYNDASANYGTVLKSSWFPWTEAIIRELLPHPYKPLARSRYEVGAPFLQKITVADLKLGMNEDKALMGEIYFEPYKNLGWIFPVIFGLKDSEGNFIQCDFYNITKENDPKILEKIFKTGRKMIILHPRCSPSPIASPMVYVEDVHEFHFLDEFPLPITDAEARAFLEESKKLKEEVNKSLHCIQSCSPERYLPAFNIFLKRRPKLVLEKDRFLLDWRYSLTENQKKLVLQHLSILFNNCSYLETDQRQYLRAFYFAQMSEWCDGNNLKAKMRKAAALIGLLRFPEAEDILEEVSGKEGAEPYQKTIRALKEAIKTGHKVNGGIDMTVSFFQDKMKWRKDCSYMNGIEGFVSEEKGRGFRAKSDIQKGETILIEAGVVSFTTKSEDFMGRLFSAVNGEEEVRALYMNLFSWLGNKTVDLFFEDEAEIAKLVKEKCKLLKSKDILRNLSMKEAQDIVNSANLFVIPNQDTGMAIFPNLCLFNHCCDPNAEYFIRRNMCLVKAKKNITKGEEVTVSYLIFEGIRQKYLSQYRFTCHCDRCEERGEWKEKEGQISGLLCPKCGSLVPMRNNKFNCPNKCWKKGVAYYQKTMKKAKKNLNKILEQKLSIVGPLEKELADCEKKFPMHSSLRAEILGALTAACVALLQYTETEERFRFYVSEVNKIIAFFPSHYLSRSLEYIFSGVLLFLSPGIKDDNLKFLEYYGLTLEEGRKIWNKLTFKEVATIFFLLRGKSLDYKPL